ncbi:MAG: hypothetical protein GY696_05165 [Gammaproteobacteria bacterium]|nr:hypothetical protein [Gammaproteobacteria bacterium]
MVVLNQSHLAILLLAQDGRNGLRAKIIGQLKRCSRSKHGGVQLFGRFLTVHLSGEFGKLRDKVR